MKIIKSAFTLVAVLLVFVTAQAKGELEIINFKGKGVTSVKIDNMLCKIHSVFNKNYKPESIEWGNCEAIIYVDRSDNNRRGVVERRHAQSGWLSRFLGSFLKSSQLSTREVSEISMEQLLDGTFVMSPNDTISVEIDSAHQDADEFLLSFVYEGRYVVNTVPTSGHNLFITPVALSVDGVFPAPNTLVVSLYVRRDDIYELLTNVMCIELVTQL